MTTTLREPATTAPTPFSVSADETVWEAEDPVSFRRFDAGTSGGGLTERRVMADGNGYCGRRSITGGWYADLLLEWSRGLPEHGLPFDEWRRT